MFKKILFAAAGLTMGLAGYSQIPEDVLKFSWQTIQGTARSQAIGNAMGSLGGDLSSIYVNPAGLAFYKTSEFVISPGLSLNNAQKSAYFNGSNKVTGDNVFTLGPTGLVVGGRGYRKDKNSAFGIAINRTANFNSRQFASGNNNISSMSEAFAEEFSRSGLSVDELLNTNSAYPYTVAPALYTYLVDTAGGKIITATDQLLDAGGSLKQVYDKKTTGGIIEVTPSFAGSTNDKFYYGGSIGINFINYNSNLSYSETDESGNTTNGFNNSVYADNFTTTGFGINARLGLIYRPQDYIRIGLSLQSPTYMQLVETRTTDLDVQLENPGQRINVSSTEFTNGYAGENRYTQGSAFKATLSGSYVFREVEDVTKQKGFISADIEYAAHNGSRFWSSNEAPTPDDKAYFKELSNVVKDIYKGAVNARVGGELKFNTLMARAGVAYYGNPLKDASYKANLMNLSGGLGYRNKGFFADLTYVHSMRKDGFYPYLTSDQYNTAATLNNTSGNVYLTLGFKF